MSNLLQKINSLETMAPVSQKIRKELEDYEGQPLKYLDKLKVFISELCSKIHLMSKDLEDMPQEIKELLQELQKKELLSQIHQECFAKVLNRPVKVKKFGGLDLEKFNKNLQKLLTDNNIQIKSYKYWHAIMDPDGDFIWYDNKIQSEFSLQKKIKVNFFKMLIPFSRKKLIQKIMHANDFKSPKAGEGLEIFPNIEEGKQFVFTYVIYSKKKLKEFQDRLRSQKEKTHSEKLELIMNDSDSDGIYFRYLQALTSQFTVKKFIISSNELSQMKAQQNSFFTHLQQNQQEINAFGECIVTLVTMKTRLSRQVPNFDFSALKNDPIIEEFRNQAIKHHIE